MRFLVALLALAMVTLPFGMGAMMSHAAPQEVHVHGSHHGETPAPAHSGKTMDFAACGACLSLPSQPTGVAAPLRKRAATPIPALESSDGQSPLPAIPPPRA